MLKRNRGFSLIELIVACAILILGLGAMVALMSSTSLALRTGTNQQEVFDESRMFMDRLTTAIKYAHADISAPEINSAADKWEFTGTVWNDHTKITDGANGQYKVTLQWANAARKQVTFTYEYAYAENGEHKTRKETLTFPKNVANSAFNPALNSDNRWQKWVSEDENVSDKWFPVRETENGTFSIVLPFRYGKIINQDGDSHAEKVTVLMAHVKLAGTSMANSELTGTPEQVAANYKEGSNASRGGTAGANFELDPVKIGTGEDEGKSLKDELIAQKYFDMAAGITGPTDVTVYYFYQNEQEEQFHYPPPGDINSILTYVMDQNTKFHYLDETAVVHFKKNSTEEAKAAAAEAAEAKVPGASPPVGTQYDYYDGWRPVYLTGDGDVTYFLADSFFTGSPYGKKGNYYIQPYSGWRDIYIKGSDNPQKPLTIIVQNSNNKTRQLNIHSTGYARILAEGDLTITTDMGQKDSAYSKEQKIKEAENSALMIESNGDINTKAWNGFHCYQPCLILANNIITVPYDKDNKAPGSNWQYTVPYEGSPNLIEREVTDFKTIDGSQLEPFFELKGNTYVLADGWSAEK